MILGIAWDEGAVRRPFSVYARVNLEVCLLILDLGQDKPAEVPTSVAGRIAVDAIFRVIEAGRAG